jgi:hypothetical protein
MLSYENTHLYHLVLRSSRELSCCDHGAISSAGSRGFSLVLDTRSAAKYSSVSFMGYRQRLPTLM